MFTPSCKVGGEGDYSTLETLTATLNKIKDFVMRQLLGRELLVSATPGVDLFNFLSFSFSLL